MKKLFVLMTVLALGVVAEMSAKKVAIDLGDCPVPCCEREELITVRTAPKLVAGYVCEEGKEVPA